MQRKLARRPFLASAAGLGAAALFLPGVNARSYAANEKLNLALVGCGSRGGNLLDSFRQIGENVVAMCDTNTAYHAAKTYQRAPDVPKHVDYRKMFQENNRGIDAVLVATCDHHHAPCSSLAMKLGKPVYCEKPLTLTVRESRELRRISQETKLPTQMGNQGAATDAFREQVEILQAGALGDVREVYVWERSGNVGLREPPTGEETPPASLTWDCWLGPRAARPYARAWVSWSVWRDFGTGQLGNWGTHATAAAFHGLNLDTLWDEQVSKSPRIRVRPVAKAESNRWSFPRWEIIDFEFPARDQMPPVVIHWFNGDDAPGFPDNIAAMTGAKLGGAGCLSVGTRGKMLASGHNSSYRIMQDGKAEPIRKPPPSLPRHGSQEREWLDAIRGKIKETFSNFTVASHEVETLMLGNVATLLGRPIEYDPVAGVCPGDDEATAALDREHREGWPV